MKRIEIYTRTPHDRMVHTLWYNPDMVSTAIKVTPHTYCLRIDGKDYLTDEADIVELYILGMNKPQDKRHQKEKNSTAKKIPLKTVAKEENI